MIHIEQVHIEEFRGIRSLELDLNTRSFVVYGPNGSGKSGVVDAIDFALTGSIARLTGAGTAGVSIQRHGPHVHRRDDPGAAIVSLTVRDVGTGDKTRLTRTVKNPGTLTFDPDTPALRAAVEESLNHPELTLSRRELIKFIVAKPGDRAAEVQALLKLDRVESTRRMLKSAVSKAATEDKVVIGERDTAERAFEQHLGLTTLLSEEVLREINLRRTVLGLALLDDLTLDTDVLSGADHRAKTSTLDTEGAKRDLEALTDALADLGGLMAARDSLGSALEAVTNAPDALDQIRHRALLTAGLAAVETPSCPLCEKEWGSEDDLRAHIQNRLQATQQAEALRAAVENAAEGYARGLRVHRALIESIRHAATELGDPELSHRLDEWTGAIRAAEQLCNSFELASVDPEKTTRAVFETPQAVAGQLSELRVALDAIPDQSREDAARTFLDVAKDRWTRVRLARAKASKTGRVRDATNIVYTAYCDAADNALSALYGAVESDFSRYYQFVNSDDEGNFRAELTPAAGSLDLKVDFYKLGLFPPVAYHSEGHQDGMGICLYLALVKQLLGDKFTFAVLDDVVMSVDANHRRRFAELLQSEFPNVQFIITTHDEVWARQMRSAGLVKTAGMVRFHGWSVDAGPTVGTGDLWVAIDADLAAGEVSAAAAKLRRALEANAADIAEGLGGAVVYRSDGAYDLSAFLDAAKGRHAKLLSIAAASAQDWKNIAQQQQVEALKARRAEVMPEHDGEVWLLNKLVHNNDWAAATEADLRPVLDAARDFLGLFQCANPECDSWLYVGRSKGKDETLRCACGNIALNLLRK
ncbi:AAA family ATPase [Microbacterium sp. NPDC091662]|uniref:AAA family ATPase n=1 Tax=Microbacterium sp. NPDC091662 TaxID=3364211 RepID=UPI0038034D98